MIFYNKKVGNRVVYFRVSKFFHRLNILLSYFSYKKLDHNLVVYTADMYDILNGCCFAVSVHVVVVVVQCSYSNNSGTHLSCFKTRK